MGSRHRRADCDLPAQSGARPRLWHGHRAERSAD
jgi:hypothetical protein